MITKAEAKAKGLRRYFSGKPCKRGHTVERLVSNGQCLECSREKLNRWRAENKEHLKQYNHQWLDENREHRQQYRQKYHAKNQETLLEKSREWYANNREHRSDYSRNRRLANLEEFRERDRARYYANPERFAENHRKWAEKNEDHLHEYACQWRAEHPEWVRERSRLWAKRNQASVRQSARKQYLKDTTLAKDRVRKWVKENPVRVRANAAAHRSRKLNATPRWLTERDKLAIHRTYAEARRMTKVTGIVHHVDHVVPLQGKNVCGLHVPGNLQIITQSQNARKSNRYDCNIHELFGTIRGTATVVGKLSVDSSGKKTK